MCGICGQYNLSGAPADAGIVRAMRDRLVHRGPDDEGEFFDGGAGLGFRRLSILDIAGGHQPMSTADGRYTIVFNGEIYNHPALRRELEADGACFRTRSDTETILELYARRGPAAFGALNGMFALALWDARAKELVLARDPLGIKPLYYHFENETLLFASELRALLAAGIEPALDGPGVIDYLAYGKVHAPRTIIRGAMKLEPGHYLRLGPEGLERRAYWRVPRAEPQGLALDEAEARLEALLSDAVRGNMLSDVPVGAFLSGGVDSSLIAALMVRHAGGAPVRTFSIGFKDAPAGVDESAAARRVARHLGTDHHELMLPAGILDSLEDSIGLLDEPIGDSAILPTFLLAKFAAERVKVVLTGEGADELFAGYGRYKAAWLNEKLLRLPSSVRRLAAPVARRLGKGDVFAGLPFADARSWAQATAAVSQAEVGSVLAPGFLDASRGDPLEWLKSFDGMSSLNDALSFDLRTVLCDSLLMKVDKSTMRASLEARVPFLDRPVVEFAAALPSAFKMRLFRGKFLLRRIAAKYVPEAIARRRKHGFIVPWEAWVRSPGNAVVRRLVHEPSPAVRAVLDADRLRIFHGEMVRGSRDLDAGLFFRIVTLGLWIESLDV